MMPLGTRRIFRPYAALSHTVIQGKIESPWKIIEFTGRWESVVSISMGPDLAESSPGTMRSSVVLPHPLGPTIMKNSPRGISIDTPSIAVNDPKRLYTSRMRIAAGREVNVAAGSGNLASGRD